MRVFVEPYNPLWAVQFAAIKKDIEGILKSASVSYKAIEHVGSTSVPGLAAKPVIDIDIIVTADRVLSSISALENSDLYRNQGELGVPQRWALRYLPPANATNEPTRNTYVTVEGCQAVRNHLTVRQMCRDDPKLRDEYSRVKLELSRQEWSSVDEYCEAKNAVIGQILTAGGMGAETTVIRDINTLVKK